MTVVNALGQDPTCQSKQNEKRRGAKRKSRGHHYLAQGTEGPPTEETEAPSIETKRKPNPVSSQNTGETGVISAVTPSKSLAGQMPARSLSCPCGLTVKEALSSGEWTQSWGSTCRGGEMDTSLEGGASKCKSLFPKLN